MESAVRVKERKGPQNGRDLSFVSVLSSLTLVPLGNGSLPPLFSSFTS